MWFRSPVHDESIKWFWFNNDLDKTLEYDVSSQPQIECSFQSNLPQNFEMNMDELENQSLMSQESDHLSQIAIDTIRSARSRGMSMDVVSPFSHCLLRDLKQHLMETKGLQNEYVLKFDFVRLHGQRQICKMSQIAIDAEHKLFLRDVQRTVNGRNSAWPQ